MQEIAIPVEARMVAFVSEVRPATANTVTALVSWRLQAGRIVADVLNDQVPLEAGMSEAEITARLTARAQEVAADYLGVQADEAVDAMRAKLGLA